MVGTLSIPKSLRADRVPDLLRRILLSAALAPAVFRAQRASATHLRRAEQAPLYERALLQCGAPALCATGSPSLENSASEQALVDFSRLAWSLRCQHEVLFQSGRTNETSFRDENA